MHNAKIFQVIKCFITLNSKKNYKNTNFHVKISIHE